MHTIYSHTALRGLAALSVCLFHVHHECSDLFSLKEWWWGFCFDWADDAVNLFFILSGFILYWVYCSQSSKVDWKKYYRARLARILPLYYLTILCFLVKPYYSLLKYGEQYVESSFLNESLMVLFMLSGPVYGPVAGINYPAWSVSVEMMLYALVFPLCVYIIARRKQQAAVSVLILSLCISTLVLARMPDVSKCIYGWQWTWAGRGVAGFVCGFILADIYISLKHRLSSARIVDFILFALLMGFMLIRYLDPDNYGLAIIMPLLVYASAHDRGIICRFSKMRALQWLGDRSYSIYLWHIPVINFYVWAISGSNKSLNGILHVSAIILVLMLLSDLSFRFFETPFRKKLMAKRLSCA